MDKREVGITWNAERDFLEKYRALMERVKRGDQTAYYQVKELRKKEFRNTVEIVNQGFYVAESGRRVVLPDDSEMISQSWFYEHERRLRTTPEERFHMCTTVEVKNIDCLYAGVQLKEQGYNPAILNMASRRNPGGGVITGAGAQEETLFRRTNLFRSLYQFAPYAEEYGIIRSIRQYPLDRNFGGIYTPNAIYFRDIEQKGYALLERPASLSFITVAGMNKPDLTVDGMIAEHHVEPIKNKIRTIFRIGLEHGHDSLVLGALGCGAFHNPPNHVARLFHEVMDEPKFRDKYRCIMFAILDDHNAHQKHNPEGNFKPFADEFDGMNIPKIIVYEDALEPLANAFPNTFGDLYKKVKQKDHQNQQSDGENISSAGETKALQMWKMGAGNSARRFSGENPIPEKTEVATKDSWKTKPMPEKNVLLPLNVTIPHEAMQVVKYGHIPEAMEDHWFMYCDESTIRYYRSWTGFCIYIAKYVEEGDKCKITELQINRDSEQYRSKDNDHDVSLFMALLTEEYGGDASAYWDKAF